MEYSWHGRTMIRRIHTRKKTGTVSVCLALSLVVILGITNLILTKITVLYQGLLEDLQVFPVVRNIDGHCKFVTYENTWGDDRTFGGDRHHEGCDIMGDTYADGTYPIVSMTDGVVEKMGWLKLGGWRIGIRSANGIYYYYAHLASYAEGLQVGETVRAGQEIGRMGSTGYSTVEGTRGNFATHLHVGIYLPTGDGERSINPYYSLKYLEKKHTMMASYSWEESSHTREEVFVLWSFITGEKN